MSEKQETKEHAAEQALVDMFDGIKTRVSNALSAFTDSDRRATALTMTISSAIYSAFSDAEDALVKASQLTGVNNDGDEASIAIEKHISHLISRANGLMLTITDAAIPADRVMAAKSVVGREVWRDHPWIDKDIAKRMMAATG